MDVKNLTVKQTITAIRKATGGVYILTRVGEETSIACRVVKTELIDRLRHFCNEDEIITVYFDLSDNSISLGY